MMLLKRGKSGYSLMELMIVVALIGVITAIAVPSYLNARYQALEHKAITNLNSFYQAQKLYYFDNPGTSIAPVISDLTPDYATISDDDGSWTYVVTTSNAGPPVSFVVTANHILPDGTASGHTITIDETGSIDTSNWPY